MAHRAAEYGVTISGAVGIDMNRVKARKDEVSGKSRQGVETWLKGMKNCTVVEGHGQFESPETVRVGDRLLKAARIFINVGARALVPPVPGLDKVRFLTNSSNSSMMAVNFLPEHLMILGGSYVGLEFGQMYRRFGSRVTIIEAGPRLIGREDEDISVAVAEILQKEGVDIRLSTRCHSVRQAGDSLIVGLDSGGNTSEITGTHFLVAVGRVPNTHDLGLDKAGVTTNAHGYVEVDDQLRTSIPHIWALGDCNGRGAFTHTSYNDHEIVADNLLNGDTRRVTDRIQTYALFIDPPLGRCGMTDVEIRKSGRNVLVAKYPMKKVSRAIEKGETQGLIKVAVDAESRQILGAAILGTGGDEIIHVLLDLMYARAPYTVLQRAMHIHPTVTEFLPTVLSELRPMT
jgi:pyruvate/2-oxoglutarate dehydrogenase complex dihydrolipoamide dehydrogenase (E3) component